MSNNKHILYRCETPPENGEPDYVFFCPGCRCSHGVWTTKGLNGAIWGFNGNVEKPTFTPSLLITRPMWEPAVTEDNIAQWEKEPWEQKQVTHVCHSFVTDGMIQFLGDSTHELKGQTVPLPLF